MTQNTLQQLIGAGRKPLVAVSSGATIADVFSAMKENKVSSCVVTGDKDHWIAAGNAHVRIGSSNEIVVGTLTMLDLVLGLLEHSAATNCIALIGSTEESRTVWTQSDSLRLKLALEPLAKRVHRVLITSTDSGTLYMCSQSDILKALAPSLKSDPTFNSLAATPIEKLACASPPFIASLNDSVLPVLVALANQNLMAVPVVDSENILYDTLSVTDLRAVLMSHMNSIDRIVDTLKRGVTVRDFLKVIRGSLEDPVEAMRQERVDTDRQVLKGVVSGHTPFGEAVDKAVSEHIHRLWIVNEKGVPVGVLSLGDMIRAFRENMV